MALGANAAGFDAQDSLMPERHPRALYLSQFIDPTSRPTPWAPDAAQWSVALTDFTPL
jgi:hypothetical protein